MGSRLGLIAFSHREAMAARLADVIEAALARAILARGSAVLAVSGGSTPAGLYEALSRRKIDWARVSAVLVDERWVPPGAEGSNESFVRAALRQNDAAALNLVGLWSDAPGPEAGLAAATARLSRLSEAIDVAVLGMGNDGHTASWFPHAEGLARALGDTGERLAAITARPSAVAGDFLERMTMTLGAVRSARLVFLLMTGAEKRATFERALEDGSVEDMPVRAILDARADLWAAWAP
jgi:6-phosphogluconolactonase